MADQDIYKLVEQLNKNKISDNSKIEEIYNILDSIDKEDNSTINLHLDNNTSTNKNNTSSANTSRTVNLADLKNKIRSVKKPTFPKEIRPFDNRSDCFFNILAEVNYGSDNNEDYTKGHRDALEKYYTIVKNNSKDLYVVEGQVNDELNNRLASKSSDYYANGYYDGLEYVSRALVKSKDLISKKIYQELLKELS